MFTLTETPAAQINAGDLLNCSSSHIAKRNVSVESIEVIDGTVRMEVSDAFGQMFAEQFAADALVTVLEFA
jgi:hypothetical protein